MSDIDPGKVEELATKAIEATASGPSADAIEPLTELVQLPLPEPVLKELQSNLVACWAVQDVQYAASLAEFYKLS